jgi:transmembrane sensor
MERPKVKLNTQIYDEASAWFVECRSGDLDESGRREFDTWLRKSPEHVSAYLEVAAIWSEGPDLDPSRKWDADSLIAAAQKDPENVVSLQPGAAVPELRDSVPSLRSTAGIQRSRAPRRRLFALAASVSGIGVLGGLWAWVALTSGVYSTAVGEQRSIELADGSTVSMNSKSKIRVRYSKGEREVDLLEGQALFHVAKDHARPFIVSASGTRVRAVGTQFDVYEKHEGTTVTVVEGEVAVLSPVTAQLPAASPGSPVPEAPERNPPLATIMVAAGEQVTVTPKLAKKSEHANVAAATAWTERRIVFESATLSEVAEEFNRYNQRQLRIEGPGLDDFHISGVFSSTDPDSLIRFLRSRPGIKVTEEGSVIRIAKII